MAQDSLHPRAQALLDAHVAYISEQCQGQALRRQIRLQVEGIIDDVEGVPLAQLLSADTVTAAAINFVQQLNLGPDLASLVGDIARHIYQHPIHRETTLTDIVPDAALEVFIDQLLDLKELRRAGLHALISNPVFAALVGEILVSGIRDFVGQSALVNKVPGAQSALKLGRRLADRARPGIGDAVEAQVRSFATERTAASLKVSERFLREALDDGAVRAVLLDMWSVIREHSIAHYRDMLTVEQVENTAMLGTAFWREFRKTDYVAAMIEAGVAGFYARHGENPIGVVLDEVGVTRELLRSTLLQLLPELMQKLAATRALDSVSRRLLNDFYASAAVQVILSTETLD